MNFGIETPGSKYSKYKTMRHQADMFGNLVKVTSPDAGMILKAHAMNDASHRDRSRPTAYVIPKGITATAVNSGDYAINYDYLVEMLKANRIEFYELKGGGTYDLSQYYYVSGNGSTTFTPSATVNTGSLVADLRAAEKVTLTNGGYVVPLDQLAGAVVLCIFEPDIANSNGYNGTVAQTLTGAEGLAVIFHSQSTNNYPYYRFEGNDPRRVLVDPDTKLICKICHLLECICENKGEIKDKVSDFLDEHGCNVGFGYLVLVLFAAVPFIIRRK
jgi:hypothetical protein